MNWLWKLLGYHVCERFTKWETQEATFTRPVTYRDGLACADRTELTYTRRWQERTCEDCGKMQQLEINL